MSMAAMVANASPVGVVCVNRIGRAEFKKPLGSVRFAARCHSGYEVARNGLRAVNAQIVM